MKKIFNFLIITLFGFYGIMLYTQNKLVFYINPRSFNASLVASILCFIVGLGGMSVILIKLIKKNNFFNKEFKIIEPKIILSFILIAMSFFINSIFLILSIFVIVIPKKNSVLDKILNHNFILNFLLIIIILTGLILSPKSLSHLSASQKSSDFNNISITEQTLNTVQGFAGSTKNYSIGDWIASLRYNPDLTFYKGKEVEVTGFIYHPDKISDNIFLVSRFIITCCAVDAQPVGLKVIYDWKKEFKQDDWVKIIGKFDIQDNEIIIIPESVKKTDLPANPYIY